MGRLDSNFLLKTYLIIAGGTVTKILFSELLSKINFRQIVFTLTSHILFYSSITNIRWIFQMFNHAFNDF